MIIDLFNIVDIITSYATVAKAFTDKGFIKEIHEARLLKHIQAPADMINELGSRLISRLADDPYLKQRVQDLIPSSKIRFQAEIMKTEKISVEPNTCSNLTLSDSSFDLLCVDRDEHYAKLTLVRRR